MHSFSIVEETMLSRPAPPFRQGTSTYLTTYVQKKEFERGSKMIWLEFVHEGR